MRILMLSHGYPPTISGVSLVAQKVARAMVRRGHTVTMVTASHEGEALREVDQGVSVERVHSWPNPYWSEGRLPITSLKQFREIMDAAQPDIVHSHDSGLLGFQLVREDREGEVPKVLTCHFYPEYVTRYVGWIDSLKRPLEKTVWEVAVRLMNQFDRTVFPTQTQQYSYIKHGLQASSTVISNGVDTSRYYPSPNGDVRIANRYRLPDGPRILYVGRLAKDKEIDVLIRSMAYPSAEFGAHLLVVGRGDDRDRLQELAQSEQLHHCIHFLGFVPEEDLPALYRQIDIFTIAATVEVQSIPTLQAVATAKPVVAVNASALPELVRDGRNGYLAPPGDSVAIGRAFAKILADPQLSRKFGQESLEISRQHAEEKTFDLHEALYEQLLAEEADNKAMFSPVSLVP